MSVYSWLNCQGNHAVASSIYKEALDLSAKKRPDLLPMLYVHFAHLQYMVSIASFHNFFGQELVSVQLNVLHFKL